jgi:AraC family transcriptional regulator
MKQFGNEWGQHFFANADSNIVVADARRPPFAVTRLVTETTPPDFTHTPTENSILIAVLLKPIERGLWNHWIDGKEVDVPYAPAFNVSVFDLQAPHTVRVKTPFDALHFNIPRQSINAFTDENGLPRISSVRPTIRENDHALANLSRLIIPFLENEEEQSELFLDHFALLLNSRLVEGYAGSSLKVGKAEGGLAPWQKRRVEELLLNHLSGNLSLERLARECNLSSGHFARAFKKSFGMSVHRWVLDRRIEHAQALMTHSALPLPDIAYRTGFSSQSTFTRAFQQRVGTSPGNWRRQANQVTRTSSTRFGRVASSIG